MAPNFALTPALSRECTGLQSWRRRAGEGALVAANGRAATFAAFAFRQSNPFNTEVADDAKTAECFFVLWIVFISRELAIRLIDHVHGQGDLQKDSVL